MIEQVQPVLPSQDVEASIRFYVEQLGFTLAFADAEHPTYAGMRRGGAEIHLQWHDSGEWERTERPMLRFVVSDIEALFNELKEKDVFHGQTALRETAWGTREFAFYDPDKNGLTFYGDV